MFMRWNLEKIWAAGNFSNSGHVEKGGGLIDKRGNAIDKVPQVEKLFMECCTKLIQNGFEVERCMPWRANAVIRVYREEDWVYDDGTYWIYGVNIYLKNFGVYFDECRIAIKPDCFPVRWMFYQDETPVRNHPFVDYFVYIKQS